MPTWTITDEEQGRLDRFLAKNVSDKSRSELQHYIKEGYVTANGTVITKNSYAVSVGDSIVLSLPEEPTLLSSQEITIPILYEDKSILVINKPAGLIVHPTDLHQTGTVIQALIHRDEHLRSVIYDKDSDISQLRPGIVHRLDKDTSGVLVVAKTITALHILAKQFHDHTVTKSYTALVVGRIVATETIHTTIKRKPFKRTMMGVGGLEEEGREAITHVTPLQSWQKNHTVITLIQAQIETGRTHQIRVHCKFKGYPVLGDETYANPTSKKMSERLTVPRQLLHASRLTLNHPITQETMHFEAPLPEDFNLILTNLGSADSL